MLLLSEALQQTQFCIEQTLIADMGHSQSWEGQRQWGFKKAQSDLSATNGEFVASFLCIAITRKLLPTNKFDLLYIKATKYWVV